MLTITASKNSIEMRRTEGVGGPGIIHLPKGNWKVAILNGHDAALDSAQGVVVESDGSVKIDWLVVNEVRFAR